MAYFESSPEYNIPEFLTAIAVTLTVTIALIIELCISKAMTDQLEFNCCNSIEDPSVDPIYKSHRCPAIRSKTYATNYLHGRGISCNLLQYQKERAA